MSLFYQLSMNHTILGFFSLFLQQKLCFIIHKWGINMWLLVNTVCINIRSPQFRNLRYTIYNMLCLHMSMYTVPGTYLQLLYYTPRDPWLSLLNIFRNDCALYNLSIKFRFMNLWVIIASSIQPVIKINYSCFFIF